MMPPLPLLNFPPPKRSSIVGFLLSNLLLLLGILLSIDIYSRMEIGSGYYSLARELFSNDNRRQFAIMPPIVELDFFIEFQEDCLQVVVFSSTWTISVRLR
ncbi:hypothetical protein BJ875DRAFT_452745 [Amylocarpus encephaloides]|uniref:Uncharacterized protein n=1 Tax=Amylocarpus encephaloides TaxID=45428 RepID=A0A9P7YPV6_9HELO|nr:hypothetical protein BJ875DRAFT_452745 [Amylocarpus encephaloides]